MQAKNTTSLNLNNIPTFLINLKERPERLERSYKECDKFFGVDQYIKRFEAIKASPAFHGIARSFLSIIMEAKEKKYKQVLILEDDINFQSELSRTYANECFNNIPKDFDVLLGGVYHAVDLTNVNEYWSKASDSCALHFSLFNESSYDKIIAFDYTTHIDRWIAQNKDIKSYIANEFFAIQFDGFSDNTQVSTEYNKTLLKNFKVLK